VARRGLVCRVARFPQAIGLLVLTNDDWNTANTIAVGGVAVFDAHGAGRVEIPGARLWAGPLIPLEKSELGVPMMQLGPHELAPVAEALVERLSLVDLCADPPRAPLPAPGPVTYPQWANVYYADVPEGVPLERKRHVVVSHDMHNRVSGGAVLVRLTTSERRGGPGFPQLSTGAKAVCVFPKFLPTRMVRTEPRARPTPGRLSLADMRLVALAIADAYELRPAPR